ALGLEQPTRRQLTMSEAGRAPAAPLFGLAPHGGCRAPSVAGGAVRSYRTVSPLPSFRRAVCFLWHFPSRRRDRGLPGMPPVWSSDFPLRDESPGAIAWPARSRADFTTESSEASGDYRVRLRSSSKKRVHSSTSTRSTDPRVFSPAGLRPKRSKNWAGAQA